MHWWPSRLELALDPTRRITQVAVGEEHVLLLASQHVLVRGGNQQGQLGLGNGAATMSKVGHQVYAPTTCHHACREKERERERELSSCRLVAG